MFNRHAVFISFAVNNLQNYIAYGEWKIFKLTVIPWGAKN